MPTGTPAPPANPKIGWKGQQALQIPKAGLVLDPGVGLYPRTDPAGGRLQLDSLRGDPPESFSLFIPGQVAAGTVLGSWTNRRPGRTAFVSALEANFGTAPSAGSATDYLKVVVTDTLGSTISLPISANGVKHYTLDQGNGVELERPFGLPGGGNDAATGTMHWFTPDQDMVISGLHWTGSTRQSGLVKAAILNGATYQPIEGASAKTPVAAGGGVNAPYSFVFPFAVKLTAHVKYAITFDIFEDYPGNSGGTGANGPAMFAGRGGGGSVISAGTIDSQVYRVLTYPAEASPAAAGPLPVTWAQVVAGTAPSYCNLGGFSPENYTGAWALIGVPSTAATSVGDLTFTIVAAGAPAGGAAGSDLNLRAVLSTLGST